MCPLPATHGMYFEEFETGQKIVTMGRTITESDITFFAGLTGDYNPIHTDAEFSKIIPFGQRIAHGLLGTSIASGLAYRTGILEGTTIAFREIKEWRFVKPIFIGDTIHVELNVQETKPIPRLKGGSVDILVDVKKQDGETVMKGTWTLLIASKP
ncbi:MAG: MaoC/PaaZ C-terminal domain-containing protein [Gammaproteobacteria bacterium]